MLCKDSLEYHKKFPMASYHITQVFNDKNTICKGYLGYDAVGKIYANQLKTFQLEKQKNRCSIYKLPYTCSFFEGIKISTLPTISGKKEPLFCNAPF